MFSETCALMLPLLLDCTIVKQHVVIWHLFSEGVKPSKIHKRVEKIHGKVYQWVWMFQNGRISILNEDHSGCLTTSWIADSVEWINALVQEDRQITVTDTADKLGISCGSVYSIISKDFGYH